MKHLKSRILINGEKSSGVPEFPAIHCELLRRSYGGKVIQVVARNFQVTCMNLRGYKVKKGPVCNYFSSFNELRVYYSLKKAVDQTYS